MIKFEVSKRNYFNGLLESKVFDTLEEADLECSIDNLNENEFFVISQWDNIVGSFEDIVIITNFGRIPLC